MDMIGISANASQDELWMDSIPVLRSIFDIIAVFNERSHHGGFLCIADVNTGAPYAIIGFGEVPVENVGKYIQFCMEKARRLASNQLHLSSFQSRNEKAQQWPGAIRSSNFIFSFSGNTWKLDEVFSLLAGDVVDELSPDNMKMIADISNNEMLTSALELLSLDLDD